MLRMYELVRIFQIRGMKFGENNDIKLINMNNTIINWLQFEDENRDEKAVNNSKSEV